MLPHALSPGSNESDHWSALVVAVDLLVRTVNDRKLQSARKCIVVVSPFTNETVPVDEQLQV